MSEMDSRRNWKIHTLTAGGILPVLGVVAVTAWVSYGHIVAVSLAHGESSAHLIPVAIDGMMFAMGCLAAVDRLRGFKPRPWATFGLWLGSIMTLAFNVMSAYTRGLAAMIIASIPALSMIICVEAVFHPSRNALNFAREHVQALAATVTTVPTTVVIPPAKAAKPPRKATAERPGPGGTPPTVHAGTRRQRRGPDGELKVHAPAVKVEA